MALLFAGLLPVLAFTFIEEKYGTWWGLIAGLLFGVGEICWELYRHRKVSKITWFGNGMLFVLGGVSLLTNEGLWFKLQPALFEGVFTLLLWGSLLRRKNLLEWMMEAQGREFPPIVKPFLRGLCFRLGLFFLVQACLATWAALSWSTEAWAFLKSIGILIFLGAYMFAEMIFLRSRVRKLSP